MKIKEKSWIWKLTGPFASKNFTTIGHTIYYPKGSPPNKFIVAHEEIHEKQWMAVGFLKFYFLYLFCLPVLWNPWRKKWETEAYKGAEKLTDEEIKKRLSSAMYGWLL
jgi:hypothetical protein